MNAILLLLTLTSTLVLRSGDRITIENVVKEENGVITFRSNGRLYSMPSAEVERVEKNDERAPSEKPVWRLRVSPEERKRLLEALERNHSGTPAPPQQAAGPNLPEPSREEVVEQRREQAYWRREARAREEAITQAREELQLLESRVDELRTQIHSFVSLGYKPHQFTYQTTQLVYAQEQLPRARLEIERAERAYAQLREDARREGVMPGWLR
jgi:hypothetical protein